jgi:hypothetical protein
MTQLAQTMRTDRKPLVAIALAATLFGGVLGGTAVAGVLGAQQDRALAVAAAQAAEDAKWLDYGRDWERQYRSENGHPYAVTTDDAKWLEYGRDWERQYRQQHPDAIAEDAKWLDYGRDWERQYRQQHPN